MNKSEKIKKTEYGVMSGEGKEDIFKNGLKQEHLDRLHIHEKKPCEELL